MRARTRIAALLASSALLVVSAATDGAAATPPSTIGGARLASHGTVVAAGAPRLPKGIDARGWLVADADTGQVLAAHDPHGKYLPASTLKTLTALTLLPRVPNRRQIITATTESTNVDGTRVGLVPRGHYSIELLFQCMLMMSGNDCATALALTAGHGSVRTALAAMNAKAHSMQALDTHAGTPSGLDAPGQSSSAYDLALILRADIKIADFRRYNSKLTGYVPAQGKKYKKFGFANDDRLRASHYPGVIAAKNGYTDAARHEFVAADRRGGHTLIVTLMHAERYPVDTQDQAIRLLDWGFAADGKISPVGTLVPAAKPRPAHPTASASTATGSTAAPTGTATTRATKTASSGHSGGGWPLPAGIGGVVLLAAAGGFVAYRRRA
jgi:D-alanyl-D-alanine carboxypeptidase (penicillin-binding protein 5/6)